MEWHQFQMPLSLQASLEVTLHSNFLEYGPYLGQGLNSDIGFVHYQPVAKMSIH